MQRTERSYQLRIETLREMKENDNHKKQERQHTCRNVSGSSNVFSQFEN